MLYSKQTPILSFDSRLLSSTACREEDILDDSGNLINEYLRRVFSRQWTIWRILSHDLHHGGGLALLLGMQGIDIPDLGEQGGHLTEPPLAEPV